MGTFLHWLPSWLISLLFWLEPYSPALFIATTGGWIAGSLAGRRATKSLQEQVALTREQYIESITPIIKIKLVRAPFVKAGKLIEYVLSATLLDSSKPANMLEAKAAISCETHGSTLELSKVLSERGRMYAPSSSCTLTLSGGGVGTCASEKCQWSVSEAHFRYEDYKRLRVYKQTLENYIEVVETRQMVDASHGESLVSRVRGWFSWSK